MLVYADRYVKMVLAIPAIQNASIAENSGVLEKNCKIKKNLNKYQKSL